MAKYDYGNKKKRGLLKEELDILPTYLYQENGGDENNTNRKN